MNEQKNNRRGIFYGVIGVATLVVAVVGATFAYFTATASNNTAISGNMASINFGLSVEKVTDVDESKGGMIPLSNSMVDVAVSKNDPCVDDNGNAVCQVYKITVTNTGTASLFLDGYVTLDGGSGVPADVINVDDEKTGDVNERTWKNLAVGEETTMRWAQVFVSGSKYTTVGKTTTGAASDAANVAGIDTNWATLAAADVTNDGTTTVYSHNTANIKTAYADVVNTTAGKISGNVYPVINRNYIRISDHVEGEDYDRNADISSALVFNQYLDAASDEVTSDEMTFYIVVWLSETGTNQTAGSDGAGAYTDKTGIGFFGGNVTFNSAQGSEVTATFSGYVAVESDQV